MPPGDSACPQFWGEECNVAGFCACYALKPSKIGNGSDQFMGFSIKTAHSFTGVIPSDTRFPPANLPPKVAYLVPHLIHQGLDLI